MIVIERIDMVIWLRQAAITFANQWAERSANYDHPELMRADADLQKAAAALAEFDSGDVSSSSQSEER